MHQNHLQDLLVYRSLGLTPRISFSFSRRPRIYIFNMFPCVDTAGPGPHFKKRCYRIRESMDIGGVVSDSEYILDFNLLHFFVLRQIMLSEVKYLIFDMSNLGNCIQFSHLGIKSKF